MVDWNCQRLASQDEWSTYSPTLTMLALDIRNQVNLEDEGNCRSCTHWQKHMWPSWHERESAHTFTYCLHMGSCITSKGKALLNIISNLKKKGISCSHFPFAHKKSSGETHIYIFFAVKIRKTEKKQDNILLKCLQTISWRCTIIIIQL